MKVLVVDDDLVLQNLFLHHLKNMGLEDTLTAQSGEEAIEKAEEHQPAVAFMDINLLTQMDGIEAAKFIKEKSPNTQIVFVSANEAPSLMERASAVENLGFLNKPYNPELIEQYIKMVKMRNLKASMSLISNFDIDNLNPETLLFQTGYLTISEVDKYDRFVLNYPNKEVEQSMLQYLLADYAHNQRNVALSYEIITAIENNDMDYLCQTLNQLFAAIPYQIFQNHSEAYFHSIIFIALKLCGYYIESEVSVATGRIDAVLAYENRIYLFEFKLDQNASIALEQIQNKDYFKKYLHTGKGLYLVGINFSSVKKEIESCEVRKM